MELSPWMIAAAAVAFVLAGLVKGVTGMGLPTVAMGVLGSFLNPVSAATLILVPAFLTNIWQLLAGRSIRTVLIRHWPMVLALTIGTFAGSTMLARNNPGHTTVALGLALIAYSVFSLFARPLALPANWEIWSSPLAGFLTGLVTGSTGVNVVPAVPYLQGLNLDRDALIQALGLTFVVSTIALGVALHWHGAMPAQHLTLSVVAVIPAFVGMAIGQAIRARMSPAVFRRGFLACIFVLGLTVCLTSLLKT